MRGLALSGGGFRATLFHLGVTSYLYDVESVWRKAASTNPDEKWEDFVNRITSAPLEKGQPSLIPDALSGLKYMTSVSGGSILAAHLVLNWEKYTDFNDRTNFDKTANELVEFTRKDIRGRIVRRMPFSIWVYIASVLWRRSPLIKGTLPDWMRRSTADSLERSYDKHLYHGAALRDLMGDDRPRLFLLTTNLGSESSSAAFTARGLTTAGLSYPHETMSLSRAVAASSAFPGMFPAVLYDPLDEDKSELKLSDGGIFDNLGVRKFWELLENGDDIHEVIVSDASIRFRAAFGLEFFEPITVPVKAADILFRRVYWFEARDARRKNAETDKCDFKFLKLREEFDELYRDDCALIAEHRECLHSTRTDLDKFSDLEIAALIRHGYSVARKVLRYPLPVTEPLRPQWNPLVQSKETMAVYEPNKAPRAELARATKRLKASEVRRKRLVSARDWVTYFTGAILIVPFALYVGLVVYTKTSLNFQQVTIDEQQTTIGQQQAKINELGKLAATIVPSNFSGKWALPLETIEVSATSAMSDAVDFVARAKSKGFKDVFIFNVWTKFGETPGTYAFRPVAVFDSRADAEAGMRKAVLEINQTATAFIPFDEFCPNAQLNATEGYYDCNNSLEELERRGFVMILQQNLPAAISDFTRAKDLSPTYHNVSEIALLLRSKQGPLAAAADSKKPEIWNEIFKTILAERSWGMPPDIKQQFQRAVK